MDRIRTLLNRVPGYTGYRDLENRRDEDKAVRNAIAEEIYGNVERLTQYSAELSAQRDFTSLSRVEQLISQVRHLGDRVRTANYGYAGLEDENSVDGAALDQLRQFDQSLQREVGSLAGVVGQLTATMPTSDDKTKALFDEITRLDGLFNGRAHVLETGRPSRDAQVLALLEHHQKELPSPLLSLQRGDTLSVLGDNYVSNATLSVSTGEGPLKLVRVSEDASGATWLMGSGIDGVPSARLTEATSDSATSNLKPAEISLVTENGERDGVAGQYAVDVQDSQNIVVTLVIGDEPRVWRGNEIRDMDVEVYGAANA